MTDLKEHRTTGSRGITDTQVLDAIRDLTTELGYAPTIRELAQHLDLTSASSVQHRLRNLAAQGLITYTPGKPRTIRIVTGDT